MTTIDDLGIEASRIYEEGRKNIDPAFPLTSNIASYVSSESAKPLSVGYWHDLFGMGETSPLWGFFLPPPGYQIHKGSLFRHGIAPGFTSPDRLESQMSRISEQREMAQKQLKSPSLPASQIEEMKEIEAAGAKILEALQNIEALRILSEKIDIEMHRYQKG